MDDIKLTTEPCDVVNKDTYSDIAAADKSVPLEVFSSKNNYLKTFCDSIVDQPDNLVPETEDVHPEALDGVVVKALEKVKKYFLNSEIEEQKLAEFMLKILTLNAKDMDHTDFKLNPDILNKLVDQITEPRDVKNDSDSFSEFLESLFGIDTAKSIHEKLSTDNIDEIVGKLLGEDTKRMICDRLESDNLDDLLNKLVDEKLAIDGDPQAKHPNFDDFIGKILGEETKEFIRKKLEVLLNDNEKSDNILEVQEIE